MPKTKIIKINSQEPEKEEIKKIAKIIKKGGLVIFPTDTVYGLGGDALSKNVIKKIYKIKKRVSNKPLLINIAYKKDLKKYVKTIPSKAKPLIKKFWPGALTIIFEKSDLIPNKLTGNTNYIGIRIPKNKIILKLIKECDTPLISTSANQAGKPTVKNTKDALKYFNNKVDIIIDGGKTDKMQSSTIIDLSKEKPTLIREGTIPIKKIMKYF